MGHHADGGGRPRIDLAAVRASADLVAIAGRYLQLRKSGNEHEALCPFHADSDPSLRIYTSRQDGVDRFVCFPCGAKGDAIDFVQKIEGGIDVIDAARMIAGEHAPVRAVDRPKPAPPAWTPLVPVPDDAPPMDPRKLWNPKREGSNGRDGKPYAGTPLRPSRTDEYRDASGRLLGYVLRCEIEGTKWTPTVTYCEHADGRRAWCLVPFADPRPLQGLDALASKPGAVVLVVSGEKCRAVAAETFPGFAVVTWPGGDNGHNKVDWSPLNGRQVTFWPDCDASGINAMREIAAGLTGASVRFLDVASLRAEFGKGADVADVVAAGWDGQRIAAWCRANVATGIPQEAFEPTETKTPTEVGACVDEAGRGPDSPGETDSGESAGAVTGEDETGVDPNPENAENATGSGEPDNQPEHIPARSRKKRGADLIDSPATNAAAYESITSWSALGLQLSDKGIPHPNLDNAARCLENHSELRGRFWFDEFLQRILSTWNADGEPREWTDADDVRLALWLQRKLGMGKMAVGTARDAVTAVAMAYRRNECREWLESLEWDKTPRLESLLPLAFGTADDAYNRAVGRCWLVSMVARVLDPGCKVDTMPVFEGPQGLRKSTALQRLVGKRWFAEASQDPTKTDFFLCLIGKLVVEIGEMDAFSKAEKETIKRVISCQSDRYRAPYGRRSEDHPRTGVFAGTTNRDDWNRDETGARRFLPAACTAVDLEWIETHRAQLFAEAVARFDRGEPWWDVPAEDAKREQESRRDRDAWEGLIDDYITGLWETTAAQVMEHCLRLPPERWDRSTQNRVGSCLRGLGWIKKDAWRGSKTVKVWFHPDSEVGSKGSKEIL